MKILTTLLTVAVLAMPILASSARADNVTANQLSAAGHGRRATMTNRPSRAIYHQNRMGRPYGHHRQHRRMGY